MDKHPSRLIKLAKRFGVVVLVTVGLLVLIPIPVPVAGYSTVLEANNGSMLGAHIASDGQWRFPLPDSLPNNFATSIRLFEDEYFFNHPGINPASIIRAIRENINAGKVIRGGSTITMQLARILRGNRSRNIWNKIIEIVIAFQLELRHSKKCILNQYTGLAPFGGNVVGIDAAAWRYYGRSPHLLSWAEAATLAVLPNAPALIYPGKGHVGLLKKRNRLLKKLLDKSHIDQSEYSLALDEPLPIKPYQLPNKAPHLLQEARKNGGTGNRILSTIDYHLQQRHSEIAANYHKFYHDNEIHNLAIIAVDIETGEIKSYVGNSNCQNINEGTQVDIIRARRSSGSILKPFLYTASFDIGLIAPTSLIPDIPTKIAGYTPLNFDKSYAGAVTSEDALSRSLNIPAVWLLRDYGLQKFYDVLQELQFKSINKPPNHYGLSLILGGAEVTLFEVVNAYRNMSINLIMQTNKEINQSNKIHYISQQESDIDRSQTIKSRLQPGAIWHALEILSNVERPRAEAGWKQFSNGRKIAWKTGTSFGHRDAWAVGMDGKHVIGVWVGNADGEGRPGLTGLNYAGPVLFDVFNTLPAAQWYPTPYDDLEYLNICRQSGYRIGQGCTDTTTVTLPLLSQKLATCSYHKRITVTASESYQVDQTCHPSDDIKNKSYFQLPSAQAYYYKKHSPDYRSLPPIKPGCESDASTGLVIIYPFANADVSIPVDINQEKQVVIFSAAHSNPNAQIHWHLDDQYIKTTRGIHEIALAPTIGQHRLLLIDNDGEETSRLFAVVD